MCAVHDAIDVATEAGSAWPPGPHAIESISRRGLLMAPLTAALLAACRDDAGTEEAQSGAATRQFKDSLGRVVEISGRPERIVALHEWSGAARVLSLGVPLTGLVTRGGAFERGIADHYDLSGVAKVGEIGQPDLEAILALRPDLIIGLASPDGKPVSGGSDGSFLAKVGAVAPTVYLDQLRPVEEFMRDMGEILGRQDAVAQQEQRWEQRFASVKQSLSDSLARLSAGWAGYFQPTFYVATAAHPFPVIQIVKALGVRFPPVTVEFAARKAAWAELSVEQVGAAQADLLFWGQASGDPRALPNWSSLPAVAAGQTVDLTDTFAGNTYDVYQRAMTFLEPVLRRVRSDVVDESAWA